MPSISFRRALASRAFCSASHSALQRRKRRLAHRIRLASTRNWRLLDWSSARHSMIAVDLGAAAHDEARRLTGARALIGVSRPAVADGPLISIARRRRLRTALSRRILLVYRCAYEDATGRLVHSRLVAMTIAVQRHGPTLLRARWSEPSLLARIDDDCGDWREAAQRVTREFALARRSRERAIAANHTAVPLSFQPGLFDRRAHR